MRKIFLTALLIFLNINAYSQSYLQLSIDKDTSWYIIDQSHFDLHPQFKKDQIDFFNDYAETMILPGKNYWKVEVFPNELGYTYESGVMIYSQILDFLIKRKLLSLRKE